MSRCRASCVASGGVVGRAIDLLVPWAMVPLAPNAATASLATVRTNISPAGSKTDSWRHTRRTMGQLEQQPLPRSPRSKR
jgi:hypothetical protein